MKKIHSFFSGIPLSKTNPSISTTPWILSLSLVVGLSLAAPMSFAAIDQLKSAGSSSGYVGNPINPGTGNKFQQETDYVGGGHFPLVLTRSYNSNWGGYVTSSGYNLPHTFGYQWISNYDTKVIFNSVGVAGPNTPPGSSGANAVVHRPDGQVLTFKQASAGSNTFTPDQDIADKLQRLTNTSGVVTGWAFTDASDNSVETYNAAGRLTTIKNSVGAIQSLTYNASNQLWKVTDPNGRQLIFAYYSNGDVQSVTLPDSNVISYGYATNGNLTQVTFSDGGHDLKELKKRLSIQVPITLS